MGTSRTPMLFTIRDALRHRVKALRVRCFCGNSTTVPILLASWKFGPGAKLSEVARRFRCTRCKRLYGDIHLALSVEPLWPRPGAWWKRQHRGPLPPPPLPYNKRHD